MAIPTAIPVAPLTKRLGIKTHIKDVKYVKLSGNIKCSGYFDDEEAILACSMGAKDGLEI